MVDKDWLDKLYGGWPTVKEEPSPGPWRVQLFKARDPRTEDDVWVVLDICEKRVAECRREVDAQYIASKCT